MTPDSEQSATYFKSVFKSLSPGVMHLSYSVGDFRRI